MLQLSVFTTPLGMWGLLGHDQTVWALTLGHQNEQTVRAHFISPFDGVSIEPKNIDWYPDLKHRLEQYSAGVTVGFEDVNLRLPQLTEFQRQVLNATRSMPYGSTMTYGELALAAGFPRAARAVGTVMSSNRFPVLIPCHRVVGSGGGLGGYSAPQGVNLKQRLLQMEAGDES